MRLLSRNMAMPPAASRGAGITATGTPAAKLPAPADTISAAPSSVLLAASPSAPAGASP